DDIRDRKGMWVPPHPHTGLQTVSWLFDGEVLHRDSVGSEAFVRPGELNLMTSGDGIAHSEESPGDHDPILHGVQLWVALPDPDRRTAEAAFHQHRDLPVVELPGATATVLVGEVAGVRSPAHSFTPLVGAEVSLQAGTPARVPLTPELEYAVLVVDGPVGVGGEILGRGQMLYLGRDREVLELFTAVEASPGARVMLLGGEPFEEELVMWWNFIGRTHEDVVEAREQWMAGLAAGHDERFGVVHGFHGDPLPAPPMPNTRLRARARSRDS
ncbi:MAG: pirin family protein, partial [Actinomycetota bacterium]|nr:pirin family protein [Actinomycetota bacterium]